jgi:hypothetical protein
MSCPRFPNNDRVYGSFNFDTMVANEEVSTSISAKLRVPHCRLSHCILVAAGLMVYKPETSVK